MWYPEFIMFTIWKSSVLHENVSTSSFSYILNVFVCLSLPQFSIWGIRFVLSSAQPLNFLAIVLFRTTQPYLESREASWICNSQPSAGKLLRRSQPLAESWVSKIPRLHLMPGGEGIFQTIYWVTFIKTQVLKGNVSLTQFFCAAFPIHPIIFSCRGSSE